ncbi:hypothetical protein [Rhizomonospora bruguierae]|uniref:hypothetical protein n=1 Tax=Rhizomonospora bruguierae TaxID=1581705 RepID=UPI001BCF2B80|nr:hypothetical protein [Micromonospora sp. NBRC 107566]
MKADTIVASGSADNAPTRAFLAPYRGAGRALDTGLPGYRRFRSWFTRPLLTRPAFLDAVQTRTLDHDLTLLLRTLHALPDRLFDGDETAFARVLGWTQPGASAALSRLSGPPVPLGRADLVRTPDGFRLVEFNTSSSLGSFEFGELCRATLSDPSFHDFAEDTLYYVDPLARMGDTLTGLAGLSLADRPTVALVDWVSSPIAVNASLFVDLMADRGFRVLSCTVADLDLTPAGLTAHGERIDVVYRTFLLKTAAEDPAAGRRLDVLDRAVRAGAVTVFTPLNADLYGTKAALAMLSDPAHRDRFTAAEREVIDRVLPWTRSMTGAARTPAEDGGSLAEFVRRHRGECVLKPSIGHAGQGVVAGWLVPQAEWDALVASADAGDYIVQRKAESVAERFYTAPVEDDPSTCFLHWGMFVTGSGLSGGFVKGLLD